MSTRAERTRDRLQACALELFTARGYDSTSVQDVASAAGVSHMTFFRHFPTKEAVVLDDPYDPAVAAAVAAQPRDLAALERVRRAFLAAWSALPEPADGQTRVRIRLAAGHAGLRGKVWQNNDRTADVVVDALVADGAGRLEARVAAGACLGALTAALFDWAADDAGEPLGGRVVAALEQLAPDGGERSGARVDEPGPVPAAGEHDGRGAP